MKDKQSDIVTKIMTHYFMQSQGVEFQINLVDETNKANISIESTSDARELTITVKDAK